MKESDDEVIEHIAQDLSNVQEDFAELTSHVDEQEDVELLRRFADDITQLEEDARDAQEIYAVREEASEIIQLLNAPLWGNVSLLYAANTFDDINPEECLLHELMGEMINHPEQYSRLFGEFDIIARRLIDKPV